MIAIKAITRCVIDKYKPVIVDGQHVISDRTLMPLRRLRGGIDMRRDCAEELRHCGQKLQNTPLVCSVC